MCEYTDGDEDADEIGHVDKIIHDALFLLDVSHRSTLCKTMGDSKQVKYVRVKRMRKSKSHYA